MLRLMMLTVMLGAMTWAITSLPAIAAGQAQSGTLAQAGGNAGTPSPGAASRQTSGTEATNTPAKWFDFFVIKGGKITLVLIGLSIISIYLTIEHSLSIRRATIIPPAAASHIQKLLDDRKYLEAVKFSAEDPSMFGYVLNAGLTDASSGYVAMERAVQEALEDRAARLFRKIEYINVIGNVSPMIGLFGTVYGMILLFAGIHASGTIPPPAKIAEDISIALVTTFWGLAVAIPSLSVFAIFRNRIDVLTADCALTVDRMLRVFRPGAQPAPSSMPAAPPAPRAS